jgi:hypothetical protein
MINKKLSVFLQNPKAKNLPKREKVTQLFRIEEMGIL